MPTIHFSDLAIQRLKNPDRQTRYFDDSLPGFGILVGKRTKTFFVVKGEDRKLITLGRYPETTLKDARALARAEMVAKATQGSLDAPEAIRLYLEDCKGRIEKQTHDQYTYYLGTLGLKSPLADVSRTHVKRKLGELAGKPTAANMLYATARGFFNWALRLEYIDKSPLAGMLPPNKLDSRDRVLTDEELKAIWNAADPETGSPGYRKFARQIRILMLTGQRRMEIGNLKPEHVSDFLTFPKTKNGHAHMIPVTPTVKDLLHVPWKFNDWNRCKEVIDERSGVTGWVVHDLRRTWATLAARLGVQIHVIEATLNHRTGAITQIGRIYNRYSYAGEIGTALLTVEEYILKLIAPTGHSAQGSRHDDSTKIGDRRDGRATRTVERSATDGRAVEDQDHGA